MTLVARNLHKRFRGRPVVAGVDFEVQPGEIVGLLGPNGAGKTTSFGMLAGLLRADEGRVLVDGEDVTGWPLHRRARRGLGYLPQEASVFRRLTVRGNLEAVLSVQRGLGRREAQDRVTAELRRFDLEDRASQRADQLSGGERRRLELARCMVIRPRWLLLDEPFAGIDPIGVRDLQGRLRGLRDQGIAIFVTDHQVRAMLALCDRTYLLAAGRVIDEGKPDELVRSEAAQSSYLGSDFRLDPRDR